MSTDEQAIKKQTLLWLVKNRKELTDMQLQLLLRLLETRNELTTEERGEFLRYLQQRKHKLLQCLADGQKLTDLKSHMLLQLLPTRDGLTDGERGQYLLYLASKEYLTHAELRELLIANLNSYFHLLVETYQGILYRYACRLTNNSHIAEEIVQDVMLSVYSTWSRYTAEHMRELNLKAYLLKSIYHEFEDARRYNLVHNPPGIPLGIDPEEGGSILAILEDPRPQPEVIVEEAEKLELVRQLPKDLQEPLWLFAMGLSYQEIAEVLGLPLQRVRSGIHRARLSLKEMKESVPE